MKPTFLNHERPLLTVMLQCETPETAIGRIRNANCLGADAYGLQVESLKPEYQNEETYKRIFAEMKGRPSYVTNYRSAKNLNEMREQIPLCPKNNLSMNPNRLILLLHHLSLQVQVLYVLHRRR